MSDIDMASRETPLQKKARQWYDDPDKQISDWHTKLRNRRFEKGEFARRIAHPQSDLCEQQKLSSRAELQGLTLASLQPEKTDEALSINRPANKTMKEPLDSVEDHDSALGLRSNPVRLSRTAAMKRNSTKEGKIKTERHDSAIENIRAPIISSVRTSPIRPTTQSPPTLRRFRFGQSFDSLTFDPAELSNTFEFENVPLTPADGPELECIASPVLETHRRGQVSIDSTQSQPPNQATRSYRATREEREQNVDREEMKKEQCRVAITFDQILGEQKIPTTLL